MIRHNILIAIRNLSRNLNYAVVNLGGLTIGLASFIFIVLYISDELSFDRFHENGDRIYRANRFYNSNNVNEDAATCSWPFGPTLAEDYPDLVEYTVRFFNGFNRQIFMEYHKNDTSVVRFNETGVYVVDSTVFDVFTFPLIIGDPSTALDEPNCVVLSETMARRYFGNEPAIGKIIRLEEQENLDLKITGVMKDIPSQSHFKMEAMVSMSTLTRQFNPQILNSWVWNPCWTYVQLREGVSQSMLEEHLPDFYINHYPDLAEQDVTLYLQPVKDIHLHSHHVYEMHPNSNIIYVYILSLIAAIVLIMACINFTNLTTAYASGRAREIGIKKVFGSSRFRLAQQFIGETILITLLSLIAAILLVMVTLEYFNHFTGKHISASFLFTPTSLLFLSTLVLAVGIVAGFYPAVVLSSFSPVTVLKGKFSGGMKSGYARKLLVVVQFSISIALIIGTFIVFSQLKYLRHKDLGFNKEQIIILPTNNQIAANYTRLKTELLSHSDIQFVTGMEDILGVNHNTRSVTIEGLNEEQSFWFPMFMVRYDFLETFDIEVVAGRGFSKDFPSDTAHAIMINETMVRNMGWSNEEAIGKRIISDGEEQVIGVFKDFHILSLHSPINNFVLDMLRNPNAANGLTAYIAIRFNTNDYPELLSFIESKWKDIAQNRPFEYSFLDEELNALYKDEDKFSKFSIMLTILAVVIAGLGLYGLTSYLAEQRTKEIGIRRVMGATTFNIIQLLSNEFLLLIAIANLLAWPAAYIFTRDWLSNFADRTSINWLFFIYSGLATVFLAWTITGIKAFSASRKNPAHTLRYE